MQLAGHLKNRNTKRSQDAVLVSSRALQEVHVSGGPKAMGPEAPMGNLGGS